jgi:hypothetical protein
VLTPSELDAITRRLAAATPGPWFVDRLAEASVYRRVARNDGGRPATSYAGNGNYRTVADYAGPADAEFLAHARRDVEALLAEVRRLRAGGV